MIEDATEASGVRRGYWGWGATFQDFDDDGHLDLFHVNGFGDVRVPETLEFVADPARLFVGTGAGTFVEMSQTAGIADTGGAGATGNSFTLAAGFRDVDVVRDVLASGESTTIPDSDVPALLLATSGTIAVVSDVGDSTDLGEGDATTLDGGLTVTNAGPDEAAFVAAAS